MLNKQSRRLLTHLLAFLYPQENDDAVASHRSSAMGKRLTDIEDIAPIVKFLCTGGQWITVESSCDRKYMFVRLRIGGQTLFAKGGYTTR